MKIKAFDWKIPHEEKKKRKRIMIVVCGLLVIVTLTLINTFAYYQSIAEQSAYNGTVGEFGSGDLKLSATIDGVKSTTIPAKTAGYAVTNVSCDKGVTGSWDETNWVAVVGNLTESGTVCDINFVTTTSLELLKDKILAQFGGATSIQAAPAGTFASVSGATEKKMYKIADDYGDSYYYRGAKDSLNNNLIFAEQQWKIIRINGNGTIRIIYNGRCPNNQCTINSTGTATQITGTHAWVPSLNTSFLVYGGGEDDSNVKVQLEAWYLQVIESQGATITSKISDVLFCADGDYTGSYSISIVNRLENNQPALVCVYPTHSTYYLFRYTVSSSTTNGHNGYLNKPVGLINADEVVLAGMPYSGTSSASNYLATGQNYWTMSPRRSNYNGAYGSGFFVQHNNSLASGNFLDSQYKPNYRNGLRPVINLNTNTRVSGDGSATNPFKVA